MTPELLQTLLQAFPALVPYAVYLSAFCGLCSVAAKYLPHPAPDAPKALIAGRALLDWLAQNSRNAANAVANPPVVTEGISPVKNIVAMLLAVLCLAVTACATTDLQAEATRLAYINQIACSSASTAQPIIVNVGSVIAVTADPADAAAVAAAVAVDAKVHDALQNACPAGTAFLQAYATGTAPVATP